MTNLNELVTLAGEHAHRVLVEEREPKLAASYLLVGADGNATIITCFWENDIQKQLAVLKIKEQAARIGATALSFVTEAWVAFRTPSNPQWDLPASQDPTRQEVVIAVATDGTDRAMRAWQIVRDRPGGRIISLVEDNTASQIGKHFEGRMIDGILP